jgi:hypothetical protein
MLIQTTMRKAQRMKWLWKIMKFKKLINKKIIITLTDNK